MPTRKEKHAIASREYVKRNPEKHATAVKNWGLKNPEKRKEYAIKHKLSNPERYLLAAVRTRSKRLGIPFDITIDDIKIPSVCPALGIPIVIG